MARRGRACGDVPTSSSRTYQVASAPWQVHRGGLREGQTPTAVDEGGFSDLPVAAVENLIFLTVCLRCFGFCIFEQTGVLRQHHDVLPLRNVTEVLIGRQTPIFQEINAARVDDVLCFSLVARDGTTHDFEAATELERDMLVAGFLRYLDSYRNPQRRFTLSSNASLQTVSSEDTEDK